MNEKEKLNEKPKEIIFFLGAGASVPASVPDTRKFIYGKTSEGNTEGFLENIDKSGTKSEKKVLRTVIEKLDRKLGKEQIDLEKVLETMINLRDLNDNVLSEFFEKQESTFSQMDLEDLENLENKLREFIRKKTMVSDDKVEYLEPLRHFTPLKIYSVNYDTCIEQFCKKYSLTYTDGFELYWHPEFFEDKKYDVKHYKLHGSVMWWLTDRDTYVKIPIKSQGESIELITGEVAKDVIVYPVPGKADYARPLLDLKSMLYQDLKQTSVCIVIGYSFRDESIKQIFFEAAEEHNDLLVVLISPSARETYNGQLKLRSNGGFSSLEGRVICFNYPVETVLETRYLWRSLKILEEIRSTFKKGEEYKKRSMGEWIDQFADCVLKCAEIGHVDRAKTILEKHPDLSMEIFKDPGKRFKLFYTMGMSLLLNDHYSEATEFFQKLYFFLKELFEIGNEVFKVGDDLAKLQEGKIVELGPGEIYPAKEYNTNEDIREKKNELRNLQKKMEYRYSLFWCVRESEWGRECFHKWVEFLRTQVDLLRNTKKDLVTEYLNPVFHTSNEIWEIISEKSDSGRFDRQKKIEIDRFEVEIERKEESEKYFNKMLDSIQELVKAFS